MPPPAVVVFRTRDQVDESFASFQTTEPRTIAAVQQLESKLLAEFDEMSHVTAGLLKIAFEEARQKSSDVYAQGSHCLSDLPFLINCRGLALEMYGAVGTTADSNWL
jgi:hypothetical protein